MKAIRYIILGCGYLPRHGSHPGTGVLIGFTLLGGLAGLQRGSILMSLFGACAMLVVFGPMYLWGAYERGRDAETYSEIEGQK